jgi:hypothetical protein
MLLVLASSAFAYRLILIPTAEVLPDGVYKMEVSAPFNAQGLDKWLPAFKFDGNIAKNFDFAVKGVCAPDEWRASSTLVNFNWTVTTETASMPGFGMGVWNIGNNGDDAATPTSYFAGLYKSFKVGLKFPIKAYANFGTKQLDGFSGGVLIPITKQCQAAAEMLPLAKDSPKTLMVPGETSRFVWAVGYNFTPNWRLKYANVGGDNAYGVVYTAHWFSK